MTTDLSPLRLLLVTLAGWVNRRQQEVIDYLVEENRVLRQQLGGRRVRLNDDQRRRLAGEGPTTRSPAAEAGGDHRDAGHDSAMAPPVDRAEVDVHGAAAGAPRDHERDLRPYRPDGHGEFWLGLHSDPGGAEEP